MGARFTEAQVQACIDTGAAHTERKYRIVRCYHPSTGRRSRAVPDAWPLTEAEAQAHCRREDTRREGHHFDSYELMRGFL